MSQAPDWLNQLINPNVIALTPYQSARRLFSGGQDWLNANESPFTHDYELDQSNFNRYPSCQPSAVLSGYAAYAGLEESNLLITRGADEGIEVLIRTFCQPGKDSILICPPTYGMYAISAQTCDVKVTNVPLKDDFQLDVDAIKAESNEPKLVFLCSPNNPTGTVLEVSDIKQVLAHFSGKALVVLDEAYIEFTDTQGWAEQLAEHPNLVILRTLSKGFALAGLRCGFTLASRDIIQALLKVIAPYPVPEPVAQIAAQALSKEGIARLRNDVSYLNQAKIQLAKRIASFPNCTLVGSDKANFILFRTPEKQAIMDFLVSHGMLIRDQSKQLNLENCLRVSIGNEEQNARLIQLLTDYFTQRGCDK